MRTRQLGRTSLRLTTVGLGTWAIGGPDYAYGWGPQDDGDSIATVRKALDEGVNWIDTAPAYGLGRAEEVVGEAIRGRARKPIVATKFGLLWKGDGSLYGHLKAESVEKECEASLRRLGMDRIDLYQMHWPNPDGDLEEAWGTVARLAKAGKILHAGLSNVSLAQVRRLQAIHPVASLQMPYSMLVRGIEEGVLDHCAREGIGMVVYSPLQKGLLTGRITRERVRGFPANDHRRSDPDFQDPALGAHLQLVEGLRQIADRRGKSVAHVAIAWTLRRPEVTSAIMGARRPDQVGENLKLGDWELAEEDARAIDALLAAHAGDRTGVRA